MSLKILPKFGQIWSHCSNVKRRFRNSMMLSRRSIRRWVAVATFPETAIRDRPINRPVTQKTFHSWRHFLKDISTKAKDQFIRLDFLYSFGPDTQTILLPSVDKPSFTLWWNKETWTWHQLMGSNPGPYNRVSKASFTPAVGRSNCCRGLGYCK